jgi:hypothetical protein
MKLKKFMATAVLAVAATGVTAVTASGQAGVASDIAVDGTDGQVAYTTTLAADHTRATVTLASGKFSLGPDTVTVTANDGTVVGTIPTALHVPTGQTFTIAPALDPTGTALTLTPVSAPVPGLHQVDGVPITVGATIGCVVGMLIGIWFFLVGALIGCMAGAVIAGSIGAWVS